MPSNISNITSRTLTDVQGVEVVNKALATATASMIADVKTAIELTLNDAVNHAKKGHGLSAHGKGRFQSQTGILVQSIQPSEVIDTGKTVEGVFFAGEEYGEFVERGTIHSEAYPFMFPAAMAVMNKFKRRIAKALTR